MNSRIRWGIPKPLEPFSLRSRADSIAFMRGDSTLSVDLMTAIGPIFFPSFDLIETHERYTLTGDLPGLCLGDLDIALRANILTITGEREVEPLAATSSCHTLERTFGSFLRTFSLPGGLDEGHWLVLMNNGVLKVEIPKHPKAKNAGRTGPKRPEGTGGKAADGLRRLQPKSDN